MEHIPVSTVKLKSADWADTRSVVRRAWGGSEAYSVERHHEVCLVCSSRAIKAGTYRPIDKRPDGVTLAPWKCGQLLVWDATCPDTFAPSYRTHATSEPGRVAALAEDRKVDKYRPALVLPALY